MKKKLPNAKEKLYIYINYIFKSIDLYLKQCQRKIIKKRMK